MTLPVKTCYYLHYSPYNNWLNKCILCFAVNQRSLYSGEGHSEPIAFTADGNEELSRPQAVQPQTQKLRCR